MGRTLSMKRLTQEERLVAALVYPRGYWRPKTRADCANVPRPCPYVGCRHHLYLDVTPAGNLKLNQPVEVWDLRESCSLDVAEREGVTFDKLGEVFGYSRQRARIE